MLSAEGEMNKGSHQTRVEGTEMAVESRVSVSTKCEIGSREAGHCDAAIQDSDFRQRMLLARTRLWKIAYAEKQHRLLGGEDCP